MLSIFARVGDNDLSNIRSVDIVLLCSLENGNQYRDLEARRYYTASWNWKGRRWSFRKGFGTACHIFHNRRTDSISVPHC